MAATSLSVVSDFAADSGSRHPTTELRSRHRQTAIKVDGLQKDSTDRAEDRQIMMKLYSADLSPCSARVRMQYPRRSLSPARLTDHPLRAYGSAALT
jgi:hypothetical protein